MLIIRTHPKTKQVNKISMDITEAEMKAWISGVPAEGAFKHLTADEINYVVTGETPVDYANLLPIWRKI